MSSEALNIILSIATILLVIIGWFAGMALKDIKADIKTIKNENQQMMLVMMGTNKDVEQAKKDITEVKAKAELLQIKNGDNQQNIIKLHELIKST